ncbi:hypothetical protein [Hansschlegelia plantiphila]|uniref:Calcium-binding protein n=1 Tax=Hansschlegelia plantiphila TaxID=374655 RepID=A0A9W6IWG6_9HYPH|nr:hypothetical protein [Hansschlegelia plantiphila]GLK66405.1 calcium-binding protein [Hansschlegelia plantiphila]
MNYRTLAGAAALLAAAFAPTASYAATGAEVIAAIDGDKDGTLDIAEVINAGVKTFIAINPDGDTTLESGETKGRLTAADWKRANRDGDQTLEMDEWLKILRARFTKADPDKDGTLDAKELDTKAGQAVILMIVK